MDWNLMLSTELWSRVGLCLLCGAMVGFERKMNVKPIGIRTCTLVCLGTMTFVYLGEQIGGAQDPTRVLGQVATGIGFLGAGAIVQNAGMVVVGMTSAAVVWVLAAVGAAIGFGKFELGLSVSLVTVFVLSGLNWADALAEAKNNRSSKSS